MKHVILFGSGGHCASCINVIRSQLEFEAKGVVVKPGSKADQMINGVPIIGSDDDINQLFTPEVFGLVAIGQATDASARIRIYDMIRANGNKLATIVASSALVSQSASLGDGSIAMHNVVIGPDVSVGDNCILNSACLIEHGVQIGSHTHVATGALINGDSKLGNCVFIGSGAIVLPGVKISDYAVIGAGEIVKRDIVFKETYRTDR